MVTIITEIQRAIQRAANIDEIDWGNMRKQLQQHKMQLTLLQSKECMTAEELAKLKDFIESLQCYVEGNWRLYETSEEDPLKVKSLYDESLNKLKNLTDDRLSFTVFLDEHNSDKRMIDMKTSLKALQKQVEQQRSLLHSHYGISQ